MIQIIKYYYGIEINEYKIDNNAYFFYYNDECFYFVLYERANNDIQDIIQISKNLKLLNINYHNIILNKFNNIISVYGGKNYILLKVDKFYFEDLCSIDMVNINNKIILSGEKRKLYKNNWKELWGNKIEYFESQIRDYGKDKKYILDTFSYYVGLAENAIEYVNRVNKWHNISDMDKITCCHRRIFYPNYKLNYLNPLSLIIDLEVRDYAEYFKSAFFKGEDIKREFVSFLKLVKMGNYSYNLFFARLLFPTYYFDAYEMVMKNKVNDKEIVDIVNKKEQYEDFIRFAYNEINKYSMLIEIPWLTKRKL